jgi:3-oxoacyl-[acyl-carrier protein] reductase
MPKEIAIVTNANEFVGPPAVKSLVECGFEVVPHDPAFVDPVARDTCQEENPGTDET